MSKSETVLMIDPDLHLGTFKLLIACHNIAHRVLVRQSRNRGALFTALELDGIISAFPIERSITIKNYSIRRRQVPIHASDRLQFSEALLDLRSRGTGVSTYSIICRTGSLNFNGAITSTKKCLSDISETNCGEGEITRPGKTDFSTMTRRNQLTWELVRLFNSLLMQFRGLK
jgi:hypothetical protein